MKIRLSKILGMALISTISLLVDTARSEDHDIQSLLQRLEAQEARIEQLEAQERAVRAQPTSHNTDVLRRIAALETAYSSSTTCGSEWEEVQQGWTSRWGGRIKFDSVNWAGQDANSIARFGDMDNYAEFRRLRLFVTGTGYGVYDYKLELEFEPEGTDPGTNHAADHIAVRDAYIGMHDIPFLGYVRIGNFREGISLEGVSNGNYLTFLERGLPNVFYPVREIGIQAYNNTRDEQFVWSYGAFFNNVSDTAKERIGDNQGIDLVGRLVWTPEYQDKGRYMTLLGGGALYRDQRTDTVRFATRAEVHEGPNWLDTGTIALDEGYHTMNLEFVKNSGSLSFQSEFFWTRLNLASGDKANLYGAYAYMSYFLTGENRVYNRKSAAFGRVKPFTNFWMVRTADGPCMGWGAWEVAARWSYVDLSDDNLAPAANQGEMHDFTLGVNWYWNGHSRMMLNYIHSFASYDAGVPNAEGDIISMRWRVDW